MSTLGQIDSATLSRALEIRTPPATPLRFGGSLIAGHLTALSRPSSALFAEELDVTGGHGWSPYLLVENM